MQAPEDVGRCVRNPVHVLNICKMPEDEGLLRAWTTAPNSHQTVRSFVLRSTLSNPTVPLAQVGVPTDQPASSLCRELPPLDVFSILHPQWRALIS
jgi:hypothetical protein